MDLTPDELRDAAHRYAECAALERVREYLEARAFSASNDIIAAIGGVQLRRSDLIAVVAMAERG